MFPVLKLEYIPNIRQSHYKPKQDIYVPTQSNNSWIFQTETEVKVKLKFVIFCGF